MIKKNISTCMMILLLGLVVTTKLVAFDWPQPPENIGILFAQIRGDSFNKGIVFSNPGEVAVAEDGIAIITLGNSVSDMGWFESPLGNTIIVTHPNDILSVYANLTNIKIDFNDRRVQSGNIIGTSGDSGWKKDNAGLEFQVIDTKTKTIINPIILMNTTPPIKQYPITSITAINRNNEKFAIRNGTSLVAGSYTLYMKRSSDTMIHSSTVSLNGVIKETIEYNTLKQSDSLLAVNGNQMYPFNTVYPDDDSMRLAEIFLSRGTNTIEISVANIDGIQTSIRYRVTVK